MNRRLLNALSYQLSVRRKAYHMKRRVRELVLYLVALNFTWIILGALGYQEGGWDMAVTVYLFAFFITMIPIVVTLTIIGVVHVFRAGKDTK